MKDNVIKFGKKILWFVWIFFLYDLTMIPIIIPYLKKRLANNWWVVLISLVVGIIVSILLIRYIWKHFNGNFNPQVTFMKSWTGKQKIVIYLILLFVIVVGGYFAGMLPTADNQTEIEKMFQKNPTSVMISTVFLSPIIEELIFRGAIQKLFFRKIETKWQMILYITLSTALFVWAHGPQFNLEMVPYILMGVTFSSAYVLLGDIKYDISLHMINNILGTIGIFLG